MAEAVKAGAAVEAEYRTVDADTVSRVVSVMTGIPVYKVAESEGWLDF